MYDEIIAIKEGEKPKKIEGFFVEDYARDGYKIYYKNKNGEIHKLYWWRNPVRYLWR